MKKIKTELVLPGGDLKRAKIALDFGADAVYVGLNKYSLRKGEVRFDIEEIGKAIDYAHSKKKKLYVTFNIFAHNDHLKDIKEDMKKLLILNLMHLLLLTLVSCKSPKKWHLKFQFTSPPKPMSQTRSKLNFIKK
jgi:collagenase-like PrtC family protease